MNPNRFERSRYSTCGAAGCRWREATTAIALSPRRTPVTWRELKGCRSMGIAATAATSGLKQLIADEIDASTKRCAQFIKR